MKFLRKILILICLLLLTGCVTTTPSLHATLPNLNGMSRDEISNKLDRLNITISVL